MADLEEHAFKRDKRFVLRLVLTLLVAFLGGLFIYGRLTNQGTANCAAGAMLGAGGEPDVEARPGARERTNDAPAKSK